MPLDINTGYNETFKAFTVFATKSLEAGKSKAIARTDGPIGILGRTITAAKGDWVGIGVGRLSSLKDANNAARTMFRKAISDMFGGEKNIPPEVINAMKLADYGKGKPLTARRILAVKDAIDASGVAKERAIAEANQEKFDKSIRQFHSPKTRKAALAKGYAQGELQKIAKTVNLYAKMMHCSDDEALEQMTTAGTKANRLMKYGGRFLQSEDNFKNGMRLLDSFSDWFDQTGAELSEIHVSTQHKVFKEKFQDGMSKTLLNADDKIFKAGYKFPVERFVFEELANNPSANLAETDPYKLFGLENNQAMGCIGRDFQSSRTQTFAQVPPEKRTIFFKALNILCPIYASTAEEAKIHPSERGTLNTVKLSIPVARILKNLDRLIALDADGKLDQKSLVKLCFPEIKKPSADPGSDVVELIDQWDADLADEDNGGKYSDNADAMREAMSATGCSIKEALQIAKGEKRLENVPYFSPGTMGLDHLGDTQAARTDLSSDLDRPDNYTDSKNGLLLGKLDFKFNFPDGESLVTNKAEGKANIPKILDRLEELCGPVHKEQASSLMMMTSQSGIAILKGGLKPFGVDSSEHSAVDFTISKNNVTGDILVRYSSPKDLPFAFQWTATIRTDGYVHTTPLQFFQNREQIATHTADANEAAANMANPENVRSKHFERVKEVAVPLLEDMMSAAGGDADVIALLKDYRVCGALMFDYKHDLRPFGTVLLKVARLKDNVAELREATKGNPLMFKLGMSRLAGLQGNAVPHGYITALVKAVNAAKIDTLKNLSAASADTPAEMHAAIAQYHQVVHDTIQKSGILVMFDELGGEEMLGMKMFVGGLVAGRCGEASLRAIQGALKSTTAGQLYACYADLKKTKFDKEGILTEIETEAVHQTAAEMQNELEQIVDTVTEALGDAKLTIPEYKGDVKELDGLPEIFNSVRDLSSQLHADLIEQNRLAAAQQNHANPAAPNGPQGENVIIEP